MGMARRWGGDISFRSGSSGGGCGFRSCFARRQTLTVEHGRLAIKSHLRKLCAELRGPARLRERADDQAQLDPAAARNFLDADNRLQSVEEFRMHAANGD